MSTRSFEGDKEESRSTDRSDFLKVAMRLSLYLIRLAVVVGIIWGFVRSLGPQRLGLGEFPPSFHQALQSALSARLPDSIVFTKAILYHGAGDVDVWIAAKVPHQDVLFLQGEFGDLNESHDSMLLQGAEYVLDRILEFEDLEFAGSSKWGEVAILPAKDGWHDVLFFTSNARQGQGASSNPLYDHFN